MEDNYWTRKQRQSAWTGGMPYGATTALRLSRRRLLAAAVAAAGTGVLIACGGGDKAKDKDEEAKDAPGGGQPAATPQASKIRRGGTLLVALEANPNGTQFDPMKSTDLYTSQVTGAVTEGLYKYNEKIEPVPWLAEKVDLSSDGRAYTFYLRKGVMFHDGTEMDAEAVKFSMDRVRDEKNKQYPGYADGKLVAETVVVDKYTYRMVLQEPNCGFPARLTGRLGAVVSPTAVRTMGEDKFGTAPVGTGPFKFKEFKNDQSARVEKYENYWRNGADDKKLPYLDAVEWRVITEPTARLTALQTGDVHIAAVRDQDVPLVKKDTNLVYAQQPGFGLGTFAFNITVPPFNNKALRQAVNFAIDREEIVRAVYEGLREVGNSFIPLTMEWALDKDFKPYSHDPQKAKAKLAEGGQPNGFEFTAWIAAGSSQTQQLFELMQAQLDKVGIKMKIEMADFNGVVIPKWQKAEPDAHVWGIGWSTGVDPDSLITNILTKDGSFNYIKYDNPRVTELIVQARSVVGCSLQERGKLYKEAMRLIMDDVPWTVLTYGIDRHVGHKKAQGWYLGVKATTSYSEFWLES